MGRWEKVIANAPTSEYAKRAKREMRTAADLARIFGDKPSGDAKPRRTSGATPTHSRSRRMAIEGPLRELGIHDVFQLLDLSRKTGMLRVSSELREDEGGVLFDNGRVVQATIRSRPPAEEVEALSERELDRKRRLQIQQAVFELMSWSEGFF